MKTRSSWFNCALRNDEAVDWISIGHNEAVVCGSKRDPVEKTLTKGPFTVQYLSVLVERSLIKPTATHCLISFVSLVSDTVSVENVSSAETLPTEGPAPKINQIDNNALLVSSEKVKIKVVSEILPLKV